MPLLKTLSNSLWLRLFVLAVVIVVTAYLLAFGRYDVTTGSMQPRLAIGDSVLVARFSYLIQDPATGDVVAFHNPIGGRVFMSRIIGRPGDTVQMRGGRLHLNGAPLERDPLGQAIDTDSLGFVLTLDRYDEVLPNGLHYVIQESTDAGPLDDTPDYAVPEGHYFMMSDNRDRAIDSRVVQGMGLVPRGNIIGRVW